MDHVKTLSRIRKECKNSDEYKIVADKYCRENNIKKSRLVRQTSYNVYLKQKTCIHELNREKFTEQDLQKAYEFHSKDKNGTKCQSDMACRLSVYKNGNCYLHHFLSTMDEIMKKEYR